MTSAEAALGALCAVIAAQGCSVQARPGYNTETDAGDPDLTFSDLELATLRNDFGDLPRAAPADPTNAYATDAAAAKLGQKLFFDARYSEGALVSCATCHIPAAGFQDNRDTTSKGVDFTGRHAPSVLDAAYGAAEPGATVWQFWDGRKDSLWSQALGPPESGVEMAGTRSKIALLIFDKYRTEYEAVFPADSPMPALRDAISGEPMIGEDAGPNGTDAGKNAWADLGERDPELQADVTRIFVNFGKAIAAYESLLVSRNSRFDRFRKALAEGFEQTSHLTPSELNGLKLFIGKAGCTSCHRGPNLTDGAFHNIGVPQTAAHVLAVDNGRADGISQVVVDDFNCESVWSDQPDKTECATAKLDTSAETVEALRGAFKTPGLRSVAQTAPYFHTGASATLGEVVDFYDQGGAQADYVGTRDENIAPLNLNDLEKQQLIDFLGTLDGEPLPSELTEAPALPD